MVVAILRQGISWLIIAIQCSRMGKQTCVLPREVQSHMASLVACVVTTYSALVMDNVMIDCFLKLYDTTPPPMRNVCPEIEW